MRMFLDDEQTKITPAVIRDTCACHGARCALVLNCGVITPRLRWRSSLVDVHVTVDDNVSLN